MIIIIRGEKILDWIIIKNQNPGSSKNIIFRDLITLDALRNLENRVGFHAFNSQVIQLLKK